MAQIQPGNTFAVSPGTYTVTVKDTYGCTKKTNSLTIAHSAGVTASASAGTINCFGGTTTLTITASGGKTPYSYGTNGTSFQTLNKFTQAAGAYTATVKDANGCKTTTSGSIAQPAAISISLSAGTMSCYGGTSTLTITATGGTPAYTYSLNGCTFQSKNTFTASATTCAVTVKDSKGCTAVRSLNISQPAAIIVTVSATPVLDNNDCGATITGISITQPATVLSLTLSKKTDASCATAANGSITVSATGGTSPLKYSLNSGTYGTSGTFSSLRAGTYTVNAKDANSCIKSITVVINGIGKCNNLSVTDPEITNADVWEGTWLKAIVSPNSSEAEFTLTLTGNSNEPVEIRVIDMYGRAVHFARGSANQSYQFGQRFTKGMYVIEILQGKFLKTVKIIKGN